MEIYWENEGQKSQQESEDESHSSTDSEDYANEEEK